ncbi:MAG TPA: outer membrane lipoprotein carrier protein LolA [Leptospiraceae bacterium]|nr:outer membrane lipoprotein carrier protein LolA [Leptospiraceae bacterium]HMW04540.1 outer membrane lipoprotein carrier protein LolA [Leptospiraceae bacterium]HMX34337.1 outer membrane lipoprotein carrier protein LolA [Leptospiraceae bacterium]HMY30726.1 outer membrane lipoprotein carrier protein LolA [Leptospiraceae bacterium]HMZ64304.1 outer membrane lipoprotein carrier protein LolA [Leptospiraceae bacterium]
MKLIFSIWLLFFSISLSAESGEELLNSIIGTMNSFESFRANISIDGLTGSISYKRPGSLNVKFSDGRVLSGNGRYLWIYSPARGIAGKQDLKGLTGGLGGLLSGYESVTSSGKVLKLKSENKYYEEIIVSVTPNNIIKSLRLRAKGRPDFMEISFSGVQTNIGLSSSIFNFHPPANAQIVENPLNQRE